MIHCSRDLNAQCSLFLPYYAFRVNSTVITNASRLPAIRKRFRIKVPRVNFREVARARHLIPWGGGRYPCSYPPQMRLSFRFRAFLCLRARVEQVKVAGLESMLGTRRGGRGMKGRMETDRGAFHP